MTIQERPSENDFRHFLLDGGTIRFVVEAVDIDPDGVVLGNIPTDGLLYGFQLQRKPQKQVVERWLSKAIRSEHWLTVEEAIMRRQGSCTYRQMSRGIFEATCRLGAAQPDDDRWERDTFGTSTVRYRHNA